MTGPEFPVLELRGPAPTGPVAPGGLSRALASGLPSTRQLLESFGPLAQSVAAAHRRGLALGCAHPSRIRLADDGRLEMAITPTPRAATVEQDVQGLGAVLYALLTGYWPLSANSAELGGLPRAPRDRFGVALEPTLVRHGLAPELSALAMAAIGTGADRSHMRVRTAAAIGRVVGDLRAEWSSEVLPPRDHAEVGQRELWRADSDTPPAQDPVTARKLSFGMTGLALGTLVVLCFVGYQAASMLGIGPPSPPRVVVGANIPPVALPPAAVAAAVPHAVAMPGAVPLGVAPPGLVPLGVVALGVVPPAGDPGVGPAPNAPTGTALVGNAPGQQVTRPQSAAPQFFDGQGRSSRGSDKASAKEKKAKKRQRDSEDD